ncbi:flagellar protein FlgN [Planococcus sp. CP5-4]|nr:flagellar protein FlgN [Planococcus sp. CP5-4_YE]MBV0909660.1 flagellar protein FlgN [Planococcus sp. CP5-4_UN]MBW6064390.1 flagellar protein FlgN [Planococcus sp. CP5-4]
MLKMMNATLDELIVIQQQLIRYAERKQTVLIEHKVDELTELVKEETRLLRRLGQLEDERERLVIEVLEEHPGLSFSQFTEQLSDETAKQALQEQLTTLKQLLMELQAKNRQNEKLVQDSVDFIAGMIGHITTPVKQPYNYQPQSSTKHTQSTNRGFFDTKA